MKLLYISMSAFSTGVQMMWVLGQILSMGLLPSNSYFSLKNWNFSG